MRKRVPSYHLWPSPHSQAQLNHLISIPISIDIKQNKTQVINQVAESLDVRNLISKKNKLLIIKNKIVSYVSWCELHVW